MQGCSFDFNGTLFFDSDKHVLAWGKLSEDLRGVGISSEELQTHFYGAPNNRAIEYLLRRSCPEEELSAYSERKEAYYRDFCSQDKERFHLVKGANAFFSKLQEQGIPFAIASASIKQTSTFSWNPLAFVVGLIRIGLSMMMADLRTKWICSASLRM